MQFKIVFKESFSNSNIFSIARTNLSTFDFNQANISSNPTNIQMQNDLARTRINEEVSDLENPPSYFELDMQHIKKRP